MQKIAVIRALLRRQQELLTRCLREQEALIDWYLKLEKETWRRQQEEQIRVEDINRFGQPHLQMLLQANERPQFFEEWQLDSIRRETVEHVGAPDGQSKVKEEGESENLPHPELLREPDLQEYTEKIEHHFLETSDHFAWRIQELLLQRLVELEQMELDYRKTESQLELYLAEKTGLNRGDPHDRLSDNDDPTDSSETPEEIRPPTFDDEQQPDGKEIAKRRKIIAQKAMRAVIDAELALGYSPEDVSDRNRGYDILSHSKKTEDPKRYIEVKGRVAGKNDIRISRNELRFAVSNVESYILAIVIVDEDIAQFPRYLRGYKFREPDPLSLNVAFDLKKLLDLSEEPS